MARNIIGPGTAQRPGLAGSRGYRAIVEAQREAEADITDAHYVQPLGGRLHLVKNPCNDTPFKVTSSGDRTYSPGSVVKLGSNTGHPGRFIISEPGGNQRGASAVGSVTVVRAFTVEAVPAGPPSDGLAPFYTAFYPVVAGYQVSILGSDGAWVSDLEQVGTGFNSAGGGAYAWHRNLDGDPYLQLFGGAWTGAALDGVNAGNGVSALDFSGAASQFRTESVGRGLLTRIVAHDGWFYWLEFDVQGGAPDTAEVHLMRSTFDIVADLEDVVTTLVACAANIQEANILDVALLGNGDVIALLLFDLASGAAYATINASDGAVLSNVGSLPAWCVADFAALPSGDDLAYAPVGVGGSPLAKLVGNTTLELAAHWPTAFNLGTGTGRLSLSPDRAEACLYYPTGKMVVHESAEGAWADEPRRAFTAPDHPTLENAPAFVVIRDPTL